jgi:hypothetical protein
MGIANPLVYNGYQPLSHAAPANDHARAIIPSSPSYFSGLNLSSSESSSDGEEELYTPEDDHHNVPPVQIATRPAMPMRGETERRLCFSHSQWSLDVPPVPIQDTRVVPPASPSTFSENWEPIHIPSIKPKCVQPDTTWMHRQSHSPLVVHTQQTSETAQVQQKQTEQDIRKQVADDQTIAQMAADLGLAHHGEGLSNIRPPKSSRWTTWHDYKVPPPDSPERDDLVLVELDVQTSLHPSITNRPRVSSPHVWTTGRSKVANAFGLGFDTSQVGSEHDAEGAENRVDVAAGDVDGKLCLPAVRTS